MTWFKVDDSLAFHRKVVAAGNAAMGLWVRAGSWCSQQLTDGHIPTDVVTVLGTPAQADRLVRAGLWTQVADGYQFHQWTENGRNPSRGEVLERRKNEADKKAKARAAKSATPQVNNTSPPGTNTGVPQGVPQGVRSTRPDPTRKEPTTADSAPETPVAHQPQHERIPTGPAATGPNATLAWQAVQTTTTPNTPTQIRGQLARTAANLLDQGATGPDLTAALLELRAHPEHGPGMLPNYLDQIQQRRHVPSRSATSGRPSSGSKRVDKALKFIEQAEAMERGELASGPLFAIEGGRSA